jgi:prevent-host-death family protein
MSKRYLSVAEIKATLSEQIRKVERGETVLITRRGKTVAALVPAGEMETLERLRASGPEGGLASIAGGWESSEELVRILETSPRIGRRENADLD